VSTVDDSEDNVNTGPGDKTTNKEGETTLDVPERNIQKKGVIVLGCFCINSFMIRIHILNESTFSLLLCMNTYIK
jgi:hypothetical protein